MEAKVRDQKSSTAEQIAAVAKTHVQSIAQLDSEPLLAEWFRGVEKSLDEAADKGATRWFGGRVPGLRELEQAARFEIQKLRNGMARDMADSVGADIAAAHLLITDARIGIIDRYCLYWQDQSDVPCAKISDGDFNFDWEPKQKKLKLGQ